MTWGYGHTGKCEDDCQCDVARMFYKQKNETSTCDICKWSGTPHGLKIHKTIKHGGKPYDQPNN